MPSVGLHAYVRDRGHGGAVGGPGDGPGTAVKIAKGEMLIVLLYISNFYIYLYSSHLDRYMIHS